MSNSIISVEIFRPLLPYIMSCIEANSNGNMEVSFAVPDELQIDVNTILQYFEDDVRMEISNSKFYKRVLTGTIKDVELSSWLFQQWLNFSISKP